MPVYRKKPVEVNVWLWDRECGVNKPLGAFPLWLQTALQKRPSEMGAFWFNGVTWVVSTLEGPHLVSYGNYLIQGVNGELFSCDPEIFEKTYEYVREF